MESHESREAKLDQDVQTVTSLCAEVPFLSVSSRSSETLTLCLKKSDDESASAEYSLNFCADYPGGTVLCCGSEVLKTSSDPLAVIVAKICEDWCTANDVTYPDSLRCLVQSTPSPDPPLESQVSVASSELSEADYYNDDDDDYDGEMYEVSDGDWESEGINNILTEEIRLVEQEFGPNSIEYRIHAGIDEMDIFYNIDLNNFLDEYTASAWGVKLEQPLVILLHIRSVNKYLDGAEPQVDVFQAPINAKTERKKVGLGSQIKKIMETFISEKWKAVSNSDIEEIISRKSSPGEASGDKVTPASDQTKDHLLAQMIDMGFSHDESLEALHATRFDIHAACTLLTQESSDTSAAAKKVENPAKKHKGFFQSFVRQFSLGAQMEEASESDEHDDPLYDKRTPPLKNGFLAQCMQYALNRIRSLNEFCVICDERHVIETGLIKPCVCTRELCVFAFQTLGVMADAAEAIATDADVVDLLIAMANTAANSSRATLILDPYPSIVDPTNPTSLAMDPKSKDFKLIKEVLSSVVASRDNLLRGRSPNIKQELDERHRLAFPLMQWIIATCRAHIVLLPEDRQIKSMKTKYQFLLISSPPSKEAAFQHAKSKHGSVFAFHGSNIENWHSIMRRGLINASGTKYQLHGAAYGKGIYLSPLSGVSFGYTGWYHSTSQQKPKPPIPGAKESLAGKIQLRCVALCEVVTSKDLKRSHDIWVCPHSDHVCTRFFFVYDDTNQEIVDNKDTRTPAFKKEIDHAVAHIRAFHKKPK